MSAADEGRHATTPDSWWSERFAFDAWTLDGTIGVTTSLTLVPNQRRAWYWAAVVGAGRPLVSLVDLDVAAPRRGLEIRADGLWADHICEEPFVAWTVVNEGYAVTLDDPDDALGDARGVPTPIAFDLGFEDDGHRRPLGGTGWQRFTQRCAVHGGIAVGTERITFDGLGERRHWWGSERWWERPSATSLPAGSRAPVALIVEGRRYRLEQVMGRDEAGEVRWGEWVQAESGP